MTTILGLAKFSACLSLSFPSIISAMPSSDYGGLEDNYILPLGGSFSPKSDNFEFKGIYSGHKVRYVVERAPEKQCCKKKLVCLNVLGEIQSGCKCKKCSGAQVPSMDGKSCQNDCPEGQGKNGKGGCCPTGMEANQQGNKCQCPQGQKEKSGGSGCEDDGEKNRKGRCPDGQVLDPKEGSSPTDDNPKCQIDDEKGCKKPKIPATRPEGKETDNSYVVDCGQPKSENERPKCQSGTHYAYTWVDTDGVANEECRKTKQFQQRKKTKVKELSAKFKEKWYKQKDSREQQKKDREDKLKQLKEHREKLQKEMEEREKLKEQNDKKKARMGKCSTVTALLMGFAQNVAQKRDGEHPYDWTSYFFDEDFITSDDRLSAWPNDIDIDTIACVSDDCGDIDAEAWMRRWEEDVSANDLQNWGSCSAGSRRSLHARCRDKRSTTEWHNQEMPNITVRYDGRRMLDNAPVSPSTDLHPFSRHELEERNPAIIIEILIEIGLFAGRLGVSLISRTAASIARWAPRLSNIAKNTDRLFKVAPRGQGTPTGIDGMKDAFGKIVQNKYFKKCLQDGLP